MFTAAENTVFGVAFPIPILDATGSGSGYKEPCLYRRHRAGMPVAFTEEGQMIPAGVN